MGLTVSRQTALILSLNFQKRLFFYLQRSKMQPKYQLSKRVRFSSNLALSADLHGLLAPEESLNLKNHGQCSQKHSL